MCVEQYRVRFGAFVLYHQIEIDCPSAAVESGCESRYQTVSSWAIFFLEVSRMILISI